MIVFHNAIEAMRPLSAFFAYVTKDDNQTYTGGATQLVIYKIDSTGVYVLSPNANKNPSTPLSYDEWDGASWFKNAYLFTEVHG